ncbi:DUF4893 domain-containing protein [Sphingomonas jeddahensis]|uniref:DUF4893 domain-containing protein n=1 Tax=Sphingomonas jeddahensis TaxID=1915074 RepID=A0A1V2EWL1_9SPHN|nr:DUF4893 domain-containing protein [Sphingomonas jeddahensis]ONF96887.1 hypothetical protein SPHI_10830 [Sphingomonas jeddahensis]
MKQALAALMAAAMLASCGGGREAPAPERGVANSDWRRVATAADRNRLRRWRTAWLDAVGRARASGAEGEIDAQGVLFDPDIVMAEAVPPPGDYRCRVFKLGAKDPGMRDYVAYTAFPCRIEDDGEVARFHKTGGSQRPMGLIFSDRSGRAVFLGTLIVGDETRVLDYGRDATRDMAGFVDRIGDRRWRLALPLPAFESTLDVIEIVPAGAGR